MFIQARNDSMARLAHRMKRDELKEVDVCGVCTSQLSWREPSPTWNVRSATSASKLMNLLSMCPKRRTAPTQRWRRSSSGRCTRALTSVLLPAQGLGDERLCVQALL